MGSHRKPRTPLLSAPAARRGALGVGAVALASTALLTQPVYADGPPLAVEEQQGKAETAAERAAEVKERVNELYREAGTATQLFNAAQEAVGIQQGVVEEVLDEAADATDRVNEARATLGSYASAQYRNGGLSDTATLLLAEDPQSYFTARHTLDRMTERQHLALDDFTERQTEAGQKRTEATTALGELEERQGEVQEQKNEVQGKLHAARTLLDELTEEEEAELQELERLEEEEAERQAEEAREAREQREQEEREEAGEQPGDGSGDVDSPAAQQAIAFAEAQLGKPYVWGATGPDSYDCSGLTQAAWRDAGVELPRVTFDQVEFGTKVARADLLPGDLVFFHDDVSHVGLYLGDGRMIHAPKPGEAVRVESIDTMPWHSANRPSPAPRG